MSEAGDDFLVLDSEAKAKEINEHRIEQGRSKKTSALVNKNDIFGDVNKQKELSIIIKSDVHGSAEALSNAILKIIIIQRKSRRQWRQIFISSFILYRFYLICLLEIGCFLFLVFLIKHFATKFIRITIDSIVL